VGTGSEELGGILKYYREKLELTQKQLANFAGIHPTTVGKIEGGERGMSLETFAKLAYHLDEDFAWRIIDTIADVSNQ
jgi:DNA-binding XRE family transcriptional regulator